MKSLSQTILILCLLLLFLGVPVMAQESGTIQAIATVVSSLKVTGVNSLNFGTVVPGVNKSVDKTDLGFAGEWQVTGEPLAELSVDFLLPNNLYTIDSSASLMISFSATDASYDDGSGGGQIAPAGSLNPNGPSVLTIGADGTLSVWIGGSVQPKISQTGGDYSADVILTVAYTGS